MTQTHEELKDDLKFVRRAVDRRDFPQPMPSAILVMWGIYVLIGYTLIDFNRVAANWFFLVAGIIGGIASSFMGKWYAGNAGQLDREEGMRHAMHWGTIWLAIVAVLALVFSRRDQLTGNQEIVGQFIALTIGLIYVLAGVHFHRYFLALGLLLIVGSIAISFVPKYGWTALGILVSAGLIAPAVIRRKSVQAQVQQ